MAKSKLRKQKSSKNNTEEVKAKCCRCLKWIPLEEYLRNDYYCDACAEKHNKELAQKALHPLSSPTDFVQYCPKDIEK